ncbi:MAG: hypothetical protein ACLT3D_10100 [Lawsonibacter sp.]
MGERDAIPALLEQQVQSSVYLEDTIRRLAELGWIRWWRSARAGPSSGFVRKTAKQIKCYPGGDGGGAGGRHRRPERSVTP